MSVEVTAEKFDETHTNVYDGQEMPSIKSRYAQTNLASKDGEIMVWAVCKSTTGPQPFLNTIY